MILYAFSIHFLYDTIFNYKITLRKYNLMVSGVSEAN